MLVDGGYVVTNAHVVWPFEQVRVVFPDKSEYLDVPVANLDLLADLAVIGPLQTSIEPLELIDGENLVIGSDLFLIGYPGEVEQFPQPSITRGILSRTRQWESVELTYFQTDAAIAGGQSGGILVSTAGEVIGLSGFFFTEAGFGLASSAVDIMPRVQTLAEGGDPSGLGDRRIPLQGTQGGYEFTLNHIWDSGVYVINEPVGTLVDIQTESANDVTFSVTDVLGEILVEVDFGATGIESGSLTIGFDEPVFLTVRQLNEESAQVQLTSNVMLATYTDVDDGKVVTRGETIVASIDYPLDLDYFVIDLVEGGTMDILVDSILVDTFVTVDFPGATELDLVSDDDSGGGLFGLNASLSYVAPHNGTYFIVVESAVVSEFGGYILTVTVD